jgi:hypothetical protein
VKGGLEREAWKLVDDASAGNQPSMKKKENGK